MPGFQELAYLEARELGVAFHRYEVSGYPVVRSGESSLQVETAEPILGRKVVLDADWVVLSVGVDGANEDLARVLGVPLDADGFFEESHPKMRPLDFTRPGLYVCGLALGPCSLPESVAQGEGAAMRAAAFLARRVLMPKETVVGVNDRLCCGCGLCVAECPYGARFLDIETGKARVVETMCLGCGACAVVCRNNATQQHGYEKARVLSAIEMALG
jgi:heterodisulfide reductase subunit A